MSPDSWLRFLDLPSDVSSFEVIRDDVLRHYGWHKLESRAAQKNKIRGKLTDGLPLLSRDSSNSDPSEY